MFMRLSYSKNSTFLSLKIIVHTLIDVRNETSKHHFLKSVKITTYSVNLLSNVYVLVHFRAKE